MKRRSLIAAALAAPAAIPAAVHAQNAPIRLRMTTIVPEGTYLFTAFSRRFVDLARTPLTNSLIVRALPLMHPDAALVPVAAIDVETLSVEPRTVRYERTGESSWRYDSLLVGATVDADVDAHGVVTNESDGFQRISE